MIQIEEKLTLITPCFCAGADQNKAELRAPSIRGQLRWWFRVLGGTAEQEKELFGGVHEGTAASKIIVRVKEVNYLWGEPKDLPQQNKPLYYLFHFANASNKNKRDPNGPRYAKKAWLNVDTTFTIEAFSRLPMKTELEELQFLQAWNAFLNFGALGLRQTRGIGSFARQNRLDYQQLIQAVRELNRHGIDCWCIGGMNGQPYWCNQWTDALKLLEVALGHIRQHGFKSDHATPLGSSNPRQASALHLRPILLKEGYLPLMYYVPKVLGEQSERRCTELADLLNSDIPCKYPYSARPQKPDNRKECRILKL